MLESEGNPRRRQFVSTNNSANQRVAQVNQRNFKSTQNCDPEPSRHFPPVTRQDANDTTAYLNHDLEHLMETDERKVAEHHFDTKISLPEPILVNNEEDHLPNVQRFIESGQHVYTGDSKASSRSSFSKLSNYSRIFQSTRTSLSLRGRELTSLPKYLFKMRNLEKLTLSPEREACLEFKLRELPREIGKLQNLQLLVLDTNELKEIPAEISLLSQLETLTLSNNFLASLPDGFSNMRNLSSLHLANNRFTEMPLEICGLSSLTFLDMTDNAIRKIPEEIGSLSKTIRTLLFYINDLESLPNAICKLTLLTMLWLGQNRLSKIPKDFGNLVHIDWEANPCSCNVDGNPLSDPPLEICRQGIIAIRDYFKAKSKTSTGYRSSRFDRK